MQKVIPRQSKTSANETHVSLDLEVWIPKMWKNALMVVSQNGVGENSVIIKIIGPKELKDHASCAIESQSQRAKEKPLEEAPKGSEHISRTWQDCRSGW